MIFNPYYLARLEQSFGGIQDLFPCFGCLAVGVAYLGDRYIAQITSSIDEVIDNASRAVAHHHAFPRPTQHRNPAPGGDTALDTVIAACDCQPHWTQQQAKHGGLNRSLLPMSALAGDQTS